MIKYSYIETMENLGIQKNDLPLDIQSSIYIFTKRAARAKDPAVLEELEENSDRIASEIVAWHDEEYVNGHPPAPAPDPIPDPVPPTPDPIPDPVPPTPDPTPNPVPPTPNPDPQPEPVKGSSDSWGLGWLSDY